MSRTLWRGTIRRFAGVIALALVLPILPIGMQAASARTPAADFGLNFDGTSQYGTAGSETDGTYSNLGATQFTLKYVGPSNRQWSHHIDRCRRSRGSDELRRARPTGDPLDLERPSAK